MGYKKQVIVMAGLFSKLKELHVSASFTFTANFNFEIFSEIDDE